MNILNLIKQEKKFLLSLFLISFLVRFITFYFFLGNDKNYWQIDSDSYNQVAVSIANGDGVTTSAGKPNFYRLPGYPFFLSIYYKIVGEDTKHVLYPQIFLASLIPILIFLLSMVLFPGLVLLAKVSSLYSAIHLGLVLYSGFFMSETLFIFLFLLFALFFFLRRFFISGIILGFASLVRPVGQYFIVLSVLLLMFEFFLRTGKIKNLKSFFRKSIGLIFGWFIPVSFWLARNYILLGSVFFHTLPGIHFLNLSAARVAMHVQDCSYWQARENLQIESSFLIDEKEKELKRPLNEIERCKALEGLAVSYFIKYPVLALKTWGTDILRASLSLYSAELLYLHNGRKQIDYFNKNRTFWDMFRRYLFPETTSFLIRFIILFEIVTFFFILLGLLFGACQVLFNFFHCVILDTDRGSQSFIVWLKILPLAMLFIVLSLAGGYARMRLPAEPFFIILSLSYWVKFFEEKYGMYKYLKLKKSEGL